MSDTEKQAAVAAPPAPKAEPGKRPAATKPKPQKPWAVIVDNDDFHTYEYVVELLQKVCNHDFPTAFTLTKQIDLEGKAVVWSGVLEVAELKRDQIRGFGTDFYASKPVKFPLGVRIEQMP